MKLIHAITPALAHQMFCDGQHTKVAFTSSKGAFTIDRAMVWDNFITTLPKAGHHEVVFFTYLEGVA